MVLLVTCAFLAPRLVARLMIMSLLAETAGCTMFLITIYTGAIPSAALLVCLHMLLRRIGAGRVFVTENTTYMRYISWCCFAGAAICIASSLYYPPWLAIGVAAAFLGIVMRVLKNVFAKAVSLQEDAELVI